MKTKGDIRQQYEVETGTELRNTAFFDNYTLWLVNKVAQQNTLNRDIEVEIRSNDKHLKCQNCGATYPYLPVWDGRVDKCPSCKHHALREITLSALSEEEINNIRERLQNIEDEDMDTVSWGYEEGVLISGNTALKIISAYDQLTKPKEE